jgi:hypothetical protein
LLKVAFNTMHPLLLITVFINIVKLKSFHQ